MTSSPNLRPTYFGRRILILVPHPDDEVVACCTAISQAQRHGAQIFTLYLTHGCIDKETLWPWQRDKYDRFVIRRLQESVQVARRLNLTPISYSDRPTRHLWRNLGDVYREITKAIGDYNINQLWIPTYEGGHPDHDGLNAVCSHLKDQISILEFAEYNFAGGKPHSHEFPICNGSETMIMLSPEEQGIKRKMLGLYESEQKNLDYVDVTQECYRPLASYDYSKPPHLGVMWYARHQWVPFKHPRVDFTKPEEVCQAIEAFSP
ncbi:MAG: PIG-L family deacetylase [Alphaproteobacteria bacterium]|nr:PIG-L family deacetylase [Alphaproteobacteria bacterium]